MTTTTPGTCLRLVRVTDATHPRGWRAGVCEEPMPCRHHPAAASLSAASGETDWTCGHCRQRNTGAERDTCVRCDAPRADMSCSRGDCPAPHGHCADDPGNGFAACARFTVAGAASGETGATDAYPEGASPAFCEACCRFAMRHSGVDEPPLCVVHQYLAALRERAEKAEAERNEATRQVARDWLTIETLRERAEANEAKAAAYDRINTPEIADFLSAVENEALHQRERWGVDADGGKEPSDWFWLVGYLAGKALHDVKGKRLHHLITTAAALLNWHGQETGNYARMRPGIDAARAPSTPSASTEVSDD